MADHHQTGKLGEALAEKLLSGKGYEILEHNWRYSRAEVDLIAKDGEVLVFVEVKTRRNISFGRPESFINQKKKQFLAEAASAYMEDTGHDWEIRFDVVSIILHSKKNYEIRHFEDAFFPGL